MPITYTVHSDGHLICAKAESPLTADEFIEYEMAHTTDERLREPVSELIEIPAYMLEQITPPRMKEALLRRTAAGRPAAPHRCAICLGSMDDHSWRLDKFYEGMAMIHAPETVIVFASPHIARRWLGFESYEATARIRIMPVPQRP